MADANLVSPEEYLATDYKVSTEYLHGALLPKPAAKRFHARLQLWIGSLLLQKFPGFAYSSELICRLSASEFCLPDISVETLLSAVDNSVATEPIYLAIEILSPDDRFATTLSKLERYHQWGVPYCWLIDPDSRACWTFHNGAPLIPAPIALDAGEIHLDVSAIFTILTGQA